MIRSRRRFLQAAAGLTAGAFLGRVASPARAADPTVADLDAAAARPVLKKELFDTPVVIDSVRLLKKGNEHLWEVYRFRSNYKLQGIALWCPGVGIRDVASVLDGVEEVK